MNKRISDFPKTIIFEDQKIDVIPLRSKRSQESSKLAVTVSSKLEDGDVRGVIRLAASDDTLAPFTDATIEELKLKHPPRAANTQLFSAANAITQSTQPNSLMSESAILAAVRSFQLGSAGGLDCLRPHHWKDLINTGTGDVGRRLLSRLTEFVNICLAGRVPDTVKPVFCGASLCALNKKGGGIRPIAVGCTWRRLVAKVACRAVMSKVAGMVSPTQIGFGIRRAAEAAAHAACIYVASLQPGQAFLKLDFTNAFNTLSRDAIQNYVATDLPEIMNFVKVCYDQSSPLCFGDYLLLLLKALCCFVLQQSL